MVTECVRLDLNFPDFQGQLFTTDRATWTNIPGQLNRLAGDD